MAQYSVRCVTKTVTYESLERLIRRDSSLELISVVEPMKVYVMNNTCTYQSARCEINGSLEKMVEIFFEQTLRFRIS